MRVTLLYLCYLATVWSAPSPEIDPEANAVIHGPEPKAESAPEPKAESAPEPEAEVELVVEAEPEADASPLAWSPQPEAAADPLPALLSWLLEPKPKPEAEAEADPNPYPILTALGLIPSPEEGGVNSLLASMFGPKPEAEPKLPSPLSFLMPKPEAVPEADPDAEAYASPLAWARALPEGQAEAAVGVMQNVVGIVGNIPAIGPMFAQLCRVGFNYG